MWEQGKDADQLNDKKFWLTAAIFVATYWRRGMTPTTIQESIDYANKFLEKYSNA